MKRTPLTYAGIIAALLAALTISITISNANANDVTTPVVKDKWSQVVDKKFSNNVALGGDATYKVAAQSVLSNTQQYKSVQKEIERLGAQANVKDWKKKSQIVELATKGKPFRVFLAFRIALADRYAQGVKNIDTASVARTKALEGAIQDDLKAAEVAADTQYNTAVNTAKSTREQGLTAAKGALDKNLSDARAAHKKGFAVAKKKQVQRMKKAKKNFRKLVRSGKAKRAQLRFSRAQERISGTYDKKANKLNDTLTAVEKQAQVDYDTAVNTVQNTYVAAEAAASAARAEVLSVANDAAIKRTQESEELVTENVEGATKTLQSKLATINVSSGQKAPKDSELAVYNKLVERQINVLKRLNRNFSFPGNFGAEFEITTREVNGTTTKYVPRVVKVSNIVPLKCDGKDCKVVVRCFGKAKKELQTEKEALTQKVHSRANEVRGARKDLRNADTKAERKEAKKALSEAKEGYQRAKSARSDEIADFVSNSTQCFKAEVKGNK